MNIFLIISLSTEEKRRPPPTTTTTTTNASRGGRTVVQPPAAPECSGTPGDERGAATSVRQSWSQTGHACCITWPVP